MDMRKGGGDQGLNVFLPWNIHFIQGELRV